MPCRHPFGMPARHPSALGQRGICPARHPSVMPARHPSALGQRGICPARHPSVMPARHPSALGQRGICPARQRLMPQTGITLNACLKIHSCHLRIPDRKRFPDRLLSNAGPYHSIVLQLFHLSRHALCNPLRVQLIFVQQLLRRSGLAKCVLHTDPGELRRALFA